jgi:hypothetical protein
MFRRGHSKVSEICFSGLGVNHELGACSVLADRSRSAADMVPSGIYVAFI